MFEKYYKLWQMATIPVMSHVAATNGSSELLGEKSHTKQPFSCWESFKRHIQDVCEVLHLTS